MKKNYKPMAYRKTEDDLSPKAYSLLTKMFNLICDSGLKVSEARLVCILLRNKLEAVIAESIMGGQE